MPWFPIKIAACFAYQPYFIALSMTSFSAGTNVHFFERDASSINIVDEMKDTTTRSEWADVMPGAVRPKLSWEIGKL